jgi:hypothetical protein
VSDGFFFAATFGADKSMLILPMEIVVVATYSTFSPPNSQALSCMNC